MRDVKISARVVTAVMSFGLVACGGDDQTVETLPFITSAPTSTPTSVGASTTLPAVEEFYTIQQGDTLFGIAQAFGVSVDDLISFNAIADPDAIQAGQRLQIPPATAAPSTTAPSTEPPTSPPAPTTP
jgi:LysM repeat protein